MTSSYMIVARRTLVSLFFLCFRFLGAEVSCFCRACLRSLDVIFSPERCSSYFLVFCGRYLQQRDRLDHCVAVCPCRVLQCRATDPHKYFSIFISNIFVRGSESSVVVFSVLKIARLVPSVPAVFVIVYVFRTIFRSIVVYQFLSAQLHVSISLSIAIFRIQFLA